MINVEALREMMAAQLRAQACLGAAVEELALWIEARGGGEVAQHARDALMTLDESADQVALCLSRIESSASGSGAF